MLRLIKIISNIIGILLILNILIAFILFPFEQKVRINFGLSNLQNKNFSTIGINDEKEFKKFIYQNYSGNYYDYENYVGWKERFINSKYFNVDKNGRYVVNRPVNCKKNVYFYGSSIAFGYLSKDIDTIASNLQKILIKNNFENICVYNHGRANYTSSRENLLFIKHITGKLLKEDDLVIFLDGSTELLPASLILKIEQDMKFQSNDFYNNFFYSFYDFIKTTPFMRFYEIINSKINNNNSELKIYNQNNIKNLINEKKNLFSDNLKIRNNLCKNYTLKCFTFIEPNGYARKQLKDTKIINNKNIFYGKNLKSFRDEIINLYGVINISNILESSNEINFIDEMHYSPFASNIIAEKIYSYMKPELK